MTDWSTWSFCNNKTADEENDAENNRQTLQKSCISLSWRRDTMLYYHIPSSAKAEKLSLSCTVSWDISTGSACTDAASVCRRATRTPSSQITHFNIITQTNIHYCEYLYQYGSAAFRLLTFLHLSPVTPGRFHRKYITKHLKQDFLTISMLFVTQSLGSKHTYIYIHKDLYSAKIVEWSWSAGTRWLDGESGLKEVIF